MSFESDLEYNKEAEKIYPSPKFTQMIKQIQDIFSTRNKPSDPLHNDNITESLVQTSAAIDYMEKYTQTYADDVPFFHLERILSDLFSQSTTKDSKLLQRTREKLIDRLYDLGARNVYSTMYAVRQIDLALKEFVRLPENSPLNPKLLQWMKERIDHLVVPRNTQRQQYTDIAKMIRKLKKKIKLQRIKYMEKQLIKQVDSLQPSDSMEPIVKIYKDYADLCTDAAILETITKLYRNAALRTHTNENTCIDPFQAHTANGDECPLCYTSIQDQGVDAANGGRNIRDEDRFMTRRGCLHSYCQNCFWEWINVSGLQGKDTTCPHCRGKIADFVHDVDT